MTALQKPPVPADNMTDSVARQHDVASYIAALTFELRQMAMAAGLIEVMAPLEQVYYKAWSAAERKAIAEAKMQPEVET
jgi:hypothetical protein